MVRLIPPMDLLFYLMETAENPKHVGAVQIYKKPEDAGEDYLRELVRQLRDVPVMAPFNAKPLFQFGQLPQWQSVPDMEMEYHVRLTEIPSPGSRKQLMKAVQQFHAGVLDRDRPGFICWVIDGLEDNRFALYIKIHHAYIDGMSGVRRLFGTLTKTPKKGAVDPCWNYQPPKKRRWRALRAAQELTGVAGMKNLLKLKLKVVMELKDTFFGIGLELMNLRTRTGYIPFSAPRTRMNRPVHSDLRSVDALTLSLRKVRDIAIHFHCTINDVFLTLIDAALREYLDDHDESPKKALVAMMPMTLRSRGDEASNTQIATLLVELGSPSADLTKRLGQVSTSAERSKQHARSLSREALMDFVLVVGGIFEFLQRTGLDANTPPSYNVLASNVPGPRVKPLFLGDARLEACYPVSTLTPGNNLNITVISHGDSFDIGLVADHSAIPDLHKISSLMESTYKKLLEHCQQADGD